MKINNSIVSGEGGKPTAAPAARSNGVERPQQPGGQGAQAAQQGSSAEVSLSPLANQLAALESSLAAGQAFDAQKVEEIKQAIRDGSLTVNAEAVASKMVDSLREMYTSAK